MGKERKAGDKTAKRLQLDLVQAASQLSHQLQVSGRDCRQRLAGGALVDLGEMLLDPADLLEVPALDAQVGEGAIDRGRAFSVPIARDAQTAIVGQGRLAETLERGLGLAHGRVIATDFGRGLIGLLPQARRLLLLPGDLVVESRDGLGDGVGGRRGGVDHRGIEARVLRRDLALAGELVVERQPCDVAVAPHAAGGPVGVGADRGHDTRLRERVDQVLHDVVVGEVRDEERPRDAELVRLVAGGDEPARDEHGRGDDGVPHARDELLEGVRIVVDVRRPALHLLVGAGAALDLADLVLGDEVPAAEADRPFHGAGRRPHADVRAAIPHTGPGDRDARVLVALDVQAAGEAADDAEVVQEVGEHLADDLAVGPEVTDLAARLLDRDARTSARAHVSLHGGYPVFRKKSTRRRVLPAVPTGLYSMFTAIRQDKKQPTPN